MPIRPCAPSDLAELIDQCEARDVTKMLAVIGETVSAGSIGRHRTLDFALAGAC
ncbi:MAG: hypothetical protein Q7T97_01955 [Burkholderiaceae bacterium]|nr:hypothetical protein [Burkholderiaceae bacterium]